MSDVVFHCTKCGSKLSAGGNEVGEEFECPICETIQIVPGLSTAPTTDPADSSTTAEKSAKPSSKRVMHVHKRKIVLHSADLEPTEEEEEEIVADEIEDEIAGSGLRVGAMALGTAGVLLCGMSFMWAIMAQEGESGEWWIMILTFTATFLLAIMGLVLAQIAFRVERIAAYVRRFLAKE